MFFTTTDLEHHPIHFDVAFHPGEVGFDESLRQLGDLHTAGKTELLRNTLGEIRITGQLRVALEADCDRCLEPAALPLDEPFDLFFRPLPKPSGHHEVRLEEGEAEISFYEGNGVDLKDAMREFVLLSLPMHTYCKPDCLGLCPHCGANRNLTACTCKTAKVDNRWAAIGDVER